MAKVKHTKFEREELMQVEREELLKDFEFQYSLWLSFSALNRCVQNIDDIYTEKKIKKIISEIEKLMNN